MSILANNIEDRERGFILVSEVLELISKATDNNKLDIVKEDLLSKDIHINIPVYHKIDKHEFVVPDANRLEGYFVSTYKALTETLIGNEYFSINSLEDSPILKKIDIFAYQRGYHYIAKQKLGKFRLGKPLGKFNSGDFVTGLSLSRAALLLKEGAIEKLTIEQYKKDLLLKHDSISPDLIMDEYDQTDDIDQQNKNCADDYLTVYSAIHLINERTGLYYDPDKLRDLARKKEITPCFYFSGYVGSSAGKRTGHLYTEFVAGYFTYGSLKDEIGKPGGYIELPSSKVKNDLTIYRVLEKQTAEYADYDEEVCLFESKPRGLNDADKLELKYINNGEIRFSKSAIDRYLDSITQVSAVPLKGQTADYEELELKFADIEKKLIEANIKIEKLTNSEQMYYDDEPKHPKSLGVMQVLIATLIKMAEYDKKDLEEPYGPLNNLIQDKASVLGLSVKKAFIANWLTKANEILKDEKLTDDVSENKKLG